MNTVEKIYQDVQDFPEPLALEVLHFVEFLKAKKPLKIPNVTTQAAIEAGERGEYEAVTLDELKKQWNEA
ncbi:MAG: DUF2281 domain-containing protein [Methylococcales bacterium]|nr:DUF2281 domain-containing protein [Methylococcales bacterium]